MHRIVAALAALALSLPTAGVAHAQLGGPNAPTPLTEPPPPPPVPQDLDEGGITGLQQVLIFGGAALVLGVIAFVIVRDARRSAPEDKRPHKGGAAAKGPKKPATAGGRSAAASSASSASTASAASAARARERQQAKRAKAKAKAAREQRKRNRPR